MAFIRAYISKETPIQRRLAPLLLGAALLCILPRSVFSQNHSQTFYDAPGFGPYAFDTLSGTATYCGCNDPKPDGTCHGNSEGNGSDEETVAATASDFALPSAGQVVLEWNEAFLAPVQEQSPPPVVVARNLAILHLAIHEVFEELDQANGTPTATAAACASSAAREVCAAFFPSRQGEFDRLWKEQTAQLPVQEKSAALERGAAIAQRWLESRRGDAAGTTTHYLPRSEPGQWRRTEPAMRPPELPRWFEVVPFVLETAAQFRPEAPPALNSSAYSEAVNEVRLMGGADSSLRTVEQTQIAHFWSDFSYTSTPPGHWNSIARTLASEEQLSAKETAKLFAILNVAMADAGIACWDAKYAYNFWRPATAIHRADEDRNEATSPDEEWRPLLAEPPHPEYVSGHATFSGAAATVLAALLGGDRVEFTTGSDAMTGAARHFSSLEECASEICMSRVYGGIHFSFSGKTGCELGRKVGEFTLENFGRALKPRAPEPITEGAAPADSLTSRTP
ncbi:MAG: vanadium-dependent haloperoxidase [Verrucomicrobiae bacterium]|nr:vanadium-dependent haloperoxidase [Verrucomicrobiae bacterium]